MNASIKVITIGTRGSALARWQTAYVSDLLLNSTPQLQVNVEVITTRGDRILNTPLPSLGGKGAFTAELEAALHQGTIDCAVHSLKDLPTENPAGLTVGAIPPRAIVNDVLICRNHNTLKTLPSGAVIGTSSRRRAAQLLHLRPDLKIIDIRGNIDTRIQKATSPDSPYDGILLAEAGVERLGKTRFVSERLSLFDMLPAPGQGALAVQCRDEVNSLSLLQPINHLQTQVEVAAERAFLAGLGGGCALPIAAYGIVTGGTLHLRGRVTSVDGVQQVDVEDSCSATLQDALQLGRALAAMALSQGVASLLEAIS
ncbi:MAG: hydroxymethylbilane synthase [Chloroflexi bacterium]|nr:hydroxymethylbilane synthase [Chloroflexota bacterium]MCC6891174.1 hydroxymethylbilane synthase [Anaerolineae bacterium]